MPNTNKIDLVTSLGEQIKNSPNFAVLQHRGLTHIKLEELRKALLKINKEIRIKVAKNSLLKVTIDSWGKAQKKDFSELKSKLKTAMHQQSALITLGDSWSEALSTIKKVTKGMDDVIVKFGHIDGSLFDLKGMTRLADLPSKPILIGKLLGSMKSPTTRLVMSIKSPTTKLVYILKAKSSQN